MNLKEEILALRNRTQTLAANLHLVVTSLDDTLGLVDSIYHADKQPDAQKKPVPNAKVVADTVQVAIAATLTTPLAKPAAKAAPKSNGQPAPAEEVPTTSTATAAWLLGCSTRMVAIHVEAGRLAQPKRGYITQESLEALLKAKAAKEQNGRPTSRPGASLAEDQIPHADAMAFLDCNLKRIMNLKYTDQLTGGRGYVDKSSLAAYMERKGLKAKAPAHENNSNPAAPEPKAATMEDIGKQLKKPRFQFDEPKPIVKDLPTTTWEPTTSPNDKWEAMDKVAKELQVNLSWLHAVKRSGRIHGAPDWINRTQLDAYLKHPDFDEPLIDKAPD